MEDDVCVGVITPVAAGAQCVEKVKSINSAEHCQTRFVNVRVKIRTSSSTRESSCDRHVPRCQGEACRVVVVDHRPLVVAEARADRLHARGCVLDRQQQRRSVVDDGDAGGIVELAIRPTDVNPVTSGERKNLGRAAGRVLQGVGGSSGAGSASGMDARWRLATISPLAHRAATASPARG